MLNLKPTGNHIILAVQEQEAKSAGGIVLAAGSLDKPFKGEVLAANDYYTMPDGSVKGAEVEAGDIVYFGKTHGTEIKHEGSTYLVISDEFILCKEKRSDG